jgi:hypothetical protein
LLYSGPLCGGETGSTGRAAGVDKEVDSFSPGKEPCRKARPRLTDLPGRKPGKRQAGWPSLLVTFLLATQEKSDSGANGARTLFASNQTTRAKPSRLKSLPQKTSSPVDGKACFAAVFAASAKEETSAGLSNFVIAPLRLRPQHALQHVPFRPYGVFQTETDGAARLSGKCVLRTGHHRCAGSRAQLLRQLAIMGRVSE